MTKSEVVFISTPGAFGNLIPLVEFADLLVNHAPTQLHATIFIITMPQRPSINTYIQSRAAAASAASVDFLHLPILDPIPPYEYQSSIAYLSLLITKSRANVKHALIELMQSELVVTFFVDMFCTCMIDVANELEIPCYMFFPSPATFLNFMFHVPVLDAATSGVDFGELEGELTIPGFANPLPPLVLPTALLKKKTDAYACYLTHTARYKEPKGIVVNTFKELEPHALDALVRSGVPRIHAIGSVVDLNRPAQWQDPDMCESVMKWLDEQPPSSVVVLCFGSMGSLSGPQVREIAFGLEKAGFRFLWALREPPKSNLSLPDNPTNVDEVLPEGFLGRTSGLGLVCGWVLQVKILAHEAIRGFVSHCGWNSILESLWYGVPIATWPIYAEQQMNAFEMVKELGLAVEIRVDSREGSKLVTAEEVERSIKRLMEGDHVVKDRVKDMRDKSRMALMENGSSHQALEDLVKELLPNI